MTSDHLLVTRDGAIMTVTLNRPDKLNAITSAMWAGIRDAVVAYRDDPALRVCLFRSTGRYFCAGSDLVGEAGKRPTDGNGGVEMREIHRSGLGGMVAVLDEMEAIEKPFVVAHHASCLGGGLELSLSCDFRLAAESTRYGFPEATFGLIPASGGVSRLTHLVGPAWAKYIIMANRPVDARRALMIGLVHDVFADADFEDAVAAFCRHLADQKPEFVGTAKLATQLAADVQRAQARNVERLANSALMLGPDHQATMAAYLERLTDKSKR